MLEGEPAEALRLRPRLGEDELELVARGEHELGARFGAHAQPVDARGSREGAVGLDPDLEAGVVKGGDERRGDDDPPTALGRRSSGEIGHRLKGANELGSAVGIAAVVYRVDADEDV